MAHDRVAVCGVVENSGREIVRHELPETKDSDVNCYKSNMAHGVLMACTAYIYAQICMCSYHLFAFLWLVCLLQGYSSNSSATRACLVITDD